MRTGDVSEVVTLVAAGVTGLLVGSFLNVVVYRVPRHLSIVHPPSHCTVCDARLTAVDMVPVVSWLVLRAQCRHCRAPISARYPIVELGTAGCFLAVAACVRSHWLVPSLAVVAAGTLAAALVDLDGSSVPPAVGALVGASALSLAPLVAVLGDPAGVGWAALGGALAGATSLVRDRTRPGRWIYVTLFASLGWSAGALWVAGGPLVAAWLTLVGVAAAARGASRAPLLTFVAGAFAVILTSAVAGTL